MRTFTSKIKIIITYTFIALLPLNTTFAQEDRNLYTKGIKAAQYGNMDFAFMNFHMFLNAYPGSKIASEVLFAMGEYHFANFNYRDATNAFGKIINDYPKSKTRIFTLVYLLEISRKQKNENLIKNLETEIASSQQIILLFREFKEYEYRSPLSKKYRAIHFIDKVEFYIDDEFFTEVSY